ncbi:MAG TPA: site-2 protease family protein [Candidatus Coprocola pullicola]|nr:site-2 protease family protein [Candidatus Coprocola pullicola]
MLSSIPAILISIIVLSIIVIIHEFGHFIVAKKSGVLVEEFAVGMGPMLFSKQIGETLYSLRALPIGGFCRMMGEENTEEISERSFNSKSVWARIAIIAAGPFMNFVLAMVLIICLVSTTIVVKPEIAALSDGYPAEMAGLQIGDVIKKINGKNVYIYDDVQMIMAENRGEPVEVELLRDGKTMIVTMTPKIGETGRYLMGFTPVIKSGFFSESVEGYERASVWDTITYSFDTMVFYVRYTAMGLAKVFTFHASKEEISGPIGIFQIVGDSYEAGIQQSVGAAVQNIMYIGAVLSANLGVLNLFPIPAMDGGRLVFLLLEAIRRKPVDPEMEGRVHFAGFVCLMVFMVFIVYNDITKIFVG